MIVSRCVRTYRSLQMTRKPFVYFRPNYEVLRIGLPLFIYSALESMLICVDSKTTSQKKNKQKMLGNLHKFLFWCVSLCYGQWKSNNFRSTLENSINKYEMVRYQLCQSESALNAEENFQLESRHLRPRKRSVLTKT